MHFIILLFTIFINLQFTIYASVVDAILIAHLWIDGWLHNPHAV
jgi:hypothetical protein